MEAVSQDGPSAQDPFYAVLMALLAHLALIQDCHQPAAEFSDLAIRTAQSDAILARALLIRARSKHAMGNFTEATTDYNQVTLRSIPEKLFHSIADRLWC